MFRHQLVRDVGVVLAAKFLLLFVGFWFFFGPEARPDLTPDRVRGHISPLVKAPSDMSANDIGAAYD